MIIERFFGKGRGGQPETPAAADPGSSPGPGGQKKSPAPNVPKSRSPGSPRHRRPARRRRRGEASRQRHRPPRHARADRPWPSPRAACRRRAHVAPASYEEIAARAYDLWVAQGRPEGRDHENWTEAERQLSAERTRG